MNSACPRRVSLITAIGTAGHSVSNHLRVDRGSPGCQRVYPRRDRLRLSLADSPTHADRIEFTAAACLGSLCYGLVVLVPLLPTSHCWDAVTVRYRTILHRTETDFHRSIFPPSQAHERRASALRVPVLKWVVRVRTNRLRRLQEQRLAEQCSALRPVADSTEVARCASFTAARRR